MKLEMMMYQRTSWLGSFCSFLAGYLTSILERWDEQRSHKRQIENKDDRYKRQMENKDDKYKKGKMENKDDKCKRGVNNKDDKDN